MNNVTYLRLIKFRRLGKDNFNYVKDIIENDRFHCSKLWDLNDPMEGVFTFENSKDIDLNKLFEGKNNHIICSFSEKSAIQNPLLWGYYANGYKGVAIEIEIRLDKYAKIEYKYGIKHKKLIEKIELFNDQKQKIGEIRRLKYVNKTNLEKIKKQFEKKYNPDNQKMEQELVKEIISRKLKCWKGEKEYRFIKQTPKSKHKIGEIVAVYFGDPYSNLRNQEDVESNSETVKDYNYYKKKLLKVCNDKNNNSRNKIRVFRNWNKNSKTEVSSRNR